MRRRDAVYYWLAGIRWIYVLEISWPRLRRAHSDPFGDCLIGCADTSIDRLPVSVVETSKVNRRRCRADQPIANERGVLAWLDLDSGWLSDVARNEFFVLSVALSIRVHLSLDARTWAGRHDRRGRAFVVGGRWHDWINSRAPRPTKGRRSCRHDCRRLAAI